MCKNLIGLDPLQWLLVEVFRDELLDLGYPSRSSDKNYLRRRNIMSIDITLH
jgi:hypothetical protein